MAALSEAESLVEGARVYEMAEMHSEMAENMKKLVILSGSKVIGKNARNLLSVAYKNLVGSKRSAWRVVKSIIERQEKECENASPEEQMKVEAKIELTKDVLGVIVKELKTVCNEVVGLLDDYLIKNAADDDAEEKTFYYKMKGDYFRYLAEVMKNDAGEFKEDCDKSDVAYCQASEASDKLSPTNPVLLGNKLNYSVFMYEIKNDPDRACKLAKEAFDKAIGELDGLQEDSYKDSTLIMQLLRDNLTLWTSEVNEGDNGDDNDKDED